MSTSSPSPTDDDDPATTLEKLRKMSNIESSNNKCAICSEPADKRCQQCKSVWYCSRDHQVADWKGGHKKRCKIIAADIAQANSHELHKQEFDRIRKQYGLDNDDNAEKIADMIANNEGEGVSAPKFANMFGMSVQEAVVFLEWIKVGVKFKEETLDTAKKAGLSK